MSKSERQNADSSLDRPVIAIDDGGRTALSEVGDENGAWLKSDVSIPQSDWR